MNLETEQGIRDLLQHAGIKNLTKEVYEKIISFCTTPDRTVHWIYETREGESTLYPKDFSTQGGYYIKDIDGIVIEYY